MLLSLCMHREERNWLKEIDFSTTIINAEDLCWRGHLYKFEVVPSRCRFASLTMMESCTILPPSEKIIWTIFFGDQDKTFDVSGLLSGSYTNIIHQPITPLLTPQSLPLVTSSWWKVETEARKTRFWDD